MFVVLIVCVVIHYVVKDKLIEITPESFFQCPLVICLQLIHHLQQDVHLNAVFTSHYLTLLMTVISARSYYLCHVCLLSTNHLTKHQLYFNFGQGCILSEHSQTLMQNNRKSLLF